MFGVTLVRIDGHSMVPKLHPGDFALFKRRSSYAVGDIVLVEHPRLGKIVKQVARSEAGGYWLEGCAPASTSSESIGLVRPQALRGKLLWSQ